MIKQLLTAAFILVLLSSCESPTITDSAATDNEVTSGSLARVLSTHPIFYYWDMDKYDYHGGTDYPDWHDMDFQPRSNLGGYSNYEWKVVVRNSSGSISYESDTESVSTPIRPYWDTAYSIDATPHIPNHFMPTHYDIHFYNQYGIENTGLRITGGTISVNDIYLYDAFQYYESEIISFPVQSGSDWETTGAVDLKMNILQPDRFKIIVKVNNIALPENLFNLTLGSGWERTKLIENIDIPESWLQQNNISGTFDVTVELESEMYYYYPLPRGFEYVASGSRSITINPATEITSLTYVSGKYPKLTWNSVPNATGYRIERKVSPGNWTTLANVNSSTLNFTDYSRDYTGLNRVTTGYRVFVKYGSTLSSSSNWVSSKTSPVDNNEE